MISPLLTDLYQLTMANGYWHHNMHEREAVFQLFFRKGPFQSDSALSCGLASVVDFIENWRIQTDDLDYLASLETPSGQALFSKDFLKYLGHLALSIDIDAIPEGEIVFPQEPLLRVRGPLLQVQLVESTLLNILNFQTLIASKAARVCEAAQGDTVLEFGLRRAQGPDGALSATRAAYIGGCAATSNVLAGKLWGIPVRGTHAHSWVSAFDSEMEAFEAYAEVMPDNCVLLVDTYSTLQGVKNAIAIGKKLREKGRELRGIRLDSGDLSDLSIQARALLDAEGFQKTRIIASNALDEYRIQTIKSEGAAINVWGVGTSLVTASDQPALDGVYKLAALRDESGRWNYKMKLSDEVVKISNPGIHQVRRFFDKDKMLADVLFDVESGASNPLSAFSLIDPLMHREFDLEKLSYQDLLIPIIRAGKLKEKLPNIHELREKAQSRLKSRSFLAKNEPYFVGLEKSLYELKQKLILDRLGTFARPL